MHNFLLFVNYYIDEDEDNYRVVRGDRCQKSIVPRVACPCGYDRDPFL